MGTEQKTEKRLSKHNRDAANIQLPSDTVGGFWRAQRSCDSPLCVID